MPSKKRPERRGAASKMTGERYTLLLDKLGLSKRAASRFLGIDARTSRRYGNNESAIPPQTAMLLELMAKHRVTLAAALKLIGISYAEAERNAAPFTAPRFYGEDAS